MNPNAADGKRFQTGEVSDATQERLRVDLKYSRLMKSSELLLPGAEEEVGEETSPRRRAPNVRKENVQLNRLGFKTFSLPATEWSVPV